MVIDVRERELNVRDDTVRGVNKEMTDMGKEI